MGPQVGAGFLAVNQDAKASGVLGQHGGPRRPRHAPVKHQDEEQVQGDVPPGGEGQEEQGDQGIAHGTKIAGEVIIKESGPDAPENQAQIGLHLRPDRLRDLQKPPQPGQQGEGQDRQRHAQQADEAEGGVGRFLEALGILRPEAQGEHHPAAHTQPQEDRREEGHQGEGGPHRRQGVGAQELPHDEGIRDVIALLEQVSQDHGQGEGEHHRQDGTFCQISCMLDGGSSSLSGKRAPLTMCGRGAGF